MHVMMVAGTRPEIIKLAPVVWALREEIAGSLCTFVLTGQHREHAQDICAELDIDVSIDLGLAAEEVSTLLGDAIRELSSMVREERPDWVVVQGDTASVLAGALAGFYNGVPVAHVEAGLRTDDLTRPFPEEANRRLVSVITRLHLAPTFIARDRLVAEGADPASVHLVGNTVVDAVRRVARRARRLGRPRRKVALVTIHRRENWGQPYDELCLGVLDLLAARPEVDVEFVMHPNPALQVRAHAHFRREPRVTLREPMTYVPFVRLLECADVVITDSGGIQEEAVSLGKPLVVLRECTERPEGVSAAAAVLAGTKRGCVLPGFDEALRLGSALDRDIYGDGRSGSRIAVLLAEGTE